MKVELIGVPEGGSRPALARTGLYVALAASAALLSACMGAPTYGTGTPADQQLAQDISGALTFGSRDKKAIQYEPRPNIVMPATTAVLPPPQDDIATASNPKWPESPEQRRTRLRAAATANQDDPSYKSGILPDVSTASAAPAQPRTLWSMSPQQEDTARTRAAFNKRLAENQQGSQTTRRYLSEPPLVYRQPAATAPIGDVGDDEWKKQKELQRQNSLPARERGKW